MRMKKRTIVLPGFLIVLGALANPPSFAQPQWKGTIVKEGEVTIIRNPKEPPYKTPILELREELSLGGPDAQGDDAFGQIGDVVVDEAGSIYVLDGRNGQVKVFDASGKYLRTIGRLGQGPGEFERPMNLSLRRTAGELAVHQASPRTAFYKPDGTFLRDVPFRGMGAVLGRADSRGYIYRNEVVIDESGARYVAKKFGPDGTALAELGAAPAPVSPKGAGRVKVAALLPASYFQLDRADNIVYGYPQAYDLMIFRGSDAKPFKKITRSYDLLEISPEDKKEFEKEIPAGSGIELEFPKYHSAYDRFFLSDLGHIFVRTWERAKDGTRIHDVFDAEGRFIGRVPLTGIGFEILKGKYYALEEDEEGYQYIKRYAVTRLVK